MNQDQAKEMLELLRKLVETTASIDERLARIERFTLGSAIERGQDGTVRYVGRTTSGPPWNG